MPAKNKPGLRNKAAPDSGVLSHKSYAPGPKCSPAGFRRPFRRPVQALSGLVQALRGVGFDRGEVLEVEVGQPDQQ